MIQVICRRGSDKAREIHFLPCPNIHYSFNREPIKATEADLAPVLCLLVNLKYSLDALMPTYIHDSAHRAHNYIFGTLPDNQTRIQKSKMKTLINY